MFASVIPWQEAYPRLADAVKAELADVAANSCLSTGELAEKLWPHAEVHDDVDVACRARIFRGLSAMIARDLKDWNRAGEPVKRMGHIRVPRLWANYTLDLPKCPHCGQLMPAAGKIVSCSVKP